MEEILYRVPLIKYIYRNRYAYETIERAHKKNIIIYNPKKKSYIWFATGNKTTHSA